MLTMVTIVENLSAEGILGRCDPPLPMIFLAMKVSRKAERTLRDYLRAVGVGPGRLRLGASPMRVLMSFAVLWI